jgi:hypothetical protein
VLPLENQEVGMTYYGGGAACRTIRKNTIQIAEDIPENKSTPLRPTRALADTVHIARLVRVPAPHSKQQDRRLEDGQLPGADAEIRRGEAKPRQA